MKLSLETRINLAFGFVLLILIGNGLSAYWSLTGITTWQEAAQAARQEGEVYAAGQRV